MSKIHIQLNRDYRGVLSKALDADGEPRGVFSPTWERIMPAGLYVIEEQTARTLIRDTVAVEVEKSDDAADWETWVEPKPERPVAHCGLCGQALPA